MASGPPSRERRPAAVMMMPEAGTSGVVRAFTVAAERSKSSMTRQRRVLLGVTGGDALVDRVVELFGRRDLLSAALLGGPCDPLPRSRRPALGMSRSSCLVHPAHPQECTDHAGDARVWDQVEMSK